MLSHPYSTKKTSLSAEQILNQFKALNDPQKILAYTDKLNKLHSKNLETQAELVPTTTLVTSTEPEFLKTQNFDIPAQNLVKTSTEPTRRPCVDFNPCKHGKCNLDNDTMQFSCACNIGYMGPFCDIMRHPCDFKPCEHGMCERVGDMYYKCLCQPNFTGVNCHISK